MTSTEGETEVGLNCGQGEYRECDNGYCWCMTSTETRVSGRPSPAYVACYKNCQTKACQNQCVAKERAARKEKAVAAPWDSYDGPTRDCYSFNKDCDGCRGYLDSCCSDTNCGGGRIC